MRDDVSNTLSVEMVALVGVVQYQRFPDESGMVLKLNFVCNYVK